MQVRQERQEGQMLTQTDYMKLDGYERVVEVRNRLAIAGYSHRELYVISGERWEGEMVVVMAYDPKWLTKAINDKDLKASLQNIEGAQSRKLGEIDYYYEVIHLFSRQRFALQAAFEAQPTLKKRISNRYGQIKSQLAGVSKGDRVEILTIDRDNILCLYPSKITHNLKAPRSLPDLSHHKFGLFLVLAAFVIWQCLY